MNFDWWNLCTYNYKWRGLSNLNVPLFQTMASEFRQSPEHFAMELESCSGQTFEEPDDEVIISTNSVADGSWEWWWCEWSVEHETSDFVPLFSVFCLKFGELFFEDELEPVWLFKLLVELFLVKTPFVTESSFGESFPLPCWGPQQVCGTQFPVSFLGHSRTQSLSSSGCTLYCNYCN